MTTLPRPLSTKSKAILKTVHAMVKESDTRMNNYTPEQRAELEKWGRKRIAEGARKAR